MGSGHHQSIWFVTLLYQWFFSSRSLIRKKHDDSRSFRDSRRIPKLVGLPSKIKGVPVYQEIGRFTMKNGGFTMKHDGFPIRNGRFTMERGEFTMKSQNKWHFISYDGNMMGRLTWVNWWFSTGDWFDDFIGKIWDSPSDPNWLQLGEVILRVACFPHFSSPCDP